MLPFITLSADLPMAACTRKTGYYYIYQMIREMHKYKDEDEDDEDHVYYEVNENKINKIKYLVGGGAAPCVWLHCKNQASGLAAINISSTLLGLMPMLTSATGFVISYNY